MARKPNQPEPWERQNGEGVKAFDAFVAYRDMEKPRSIRKVAQKLGKSETLIARWSSEKEWVKRVEAWDDEQDRIAREAQIDEIKKMRKRHTQLAVDMLEKAARAMNMIPDEEMTALDVNRFAETASKLERISRGDVGEVIEERDGGKSASPVTFYIPDNHRDQEEEELDV